MDGIAQFKEIFATFLVNLRQELVSPWLGIQLVLILVAAGVAWLIATLIRRRADILTPSLRWPPVLRVLMRLLLAKIGTIIFVLVLVVVHEVMQSLTWPSRSYLLGVAVSLATAWVVIAFVAGLIRNPFVHRIVAVSAWTIAALSIVGLLRPTMATLDLFGVVVGGLRVTPLLVIKTSILLLLTLWAANAASDFLERRVRSQADLTPSI